jgi:hypothetical protein
MKANQIFRGVRWPSAASRIGFIGACLALTSACSGSIEETEVDRVHLENGSTGLKQTAAPTASTTAPRATPVANPPPATPPAAAPPATTPPAETTPTANPPPAAPPVAPGGDISFAADVWPIFSEGCSTCHTTSALGGQSVGSPDKAKAMADAIRIEAAVLRDVGSGRMPIGCGKPPGGGGNCLTEEDFETIQEWYEAGTPP